MLAHPFQFQFWYGSPSYGLARLHIVYQIWSFGASGKMRERRTSLARGYVMPSHTARRFSGKIEASKRRLFVMKPVISLNPDANLVETVREGLKRTGGYCPCRLERSEDTKCICQEFRQQMEDPNFEGYCHCMLYYKSNPKEAGV
jgi:ferredoxin-thioredoxin reductase catalytic subunit